MGGKFESGEVLKTLRCSVRESGSRVWCHTDRFNLVRTVQSCRRRRMAFILLFAEGRTRAKK